MPPRGVKSSKRKRQYEHIKQSERKTGRSLKRAKEIAARTVNKQRRKAGTTKSAGSRRRKATSGRGRTAGRSTRSRSSGRSRSRR